MKQKKAAIRFRKQFLYEILQNSDSGVELRKTNQHLALHPLHLNKLQSSIKTLLDIKIGKFDKELDGIILGHDNIKLLSNLGILNNDSPYIHIDIEVDIFIFKVMINQVLTGIINKISERHVGCLVHNAFNVSLIPPKGENRWRGSAFTLGQKVIFSVSETDFEGHIPYIRGLLREVQDSPVETTELHTETKKKRKRSDEESIEIKPKIKKERLN